MDNWSESQARKLDNRVESGSSVSLRNRPDMSRKLVIHQENAKNSEWLTSAEVALLLKSSAWCAICDKLVDVAEAYSEYAMYNHGQRRTFFCVRCHDRKEEGICDPVEMARSKEKTGKVLFFIPASTRSRETENITASPIPLLLETSE